MTCWKQATVGLLCAIPFGLSAASGQASHDSGEVLLKAAIAARSWENRYESTTTVQSRATVKEAARQFMVGMDTTVSKYRDGDRLHFISEYVDHVSHSGAVIISASRRETVVVQNVRTSWWIPLDKPLRGTLQLAKDAKRVEKMKTVDRRDCLSGSFLDGYVDGRGNIAELLLQSSSPPEVHDERVVGKVGTIDCKHVEAKSRGIVMDAWIAPTEGNCIVKYLIQDDDPATGPMHAEFEATGFAKSGNAIAVAGGRYSSNWVDRQSHALWSQTIVANRTSLNLQPEFKRPNLFTTRDAPDGIRVFLDDLPDVGIDFVWSGGKPVAKVDPTLFQDLGTSVRRTVAGEVSDTAPAIPASISVGHSDDGTGRVTQLWVLLGSATVVLGTLLVAVLLNRGTRGATR